MLLYESYVTMPHVYRYLFMNLELCAITVGIVNDQIRALCLLHDLLNVKLQETTLFRFLLEYVSYPLLKWRAGFLHFAIRTSGADTKQLQLNLHQSNQASSFPPPSIPSRLLPQPLPPPEEIVCKRNTVCTRMPKAFKCEAVV